jgi:hypothetical protein
LIVNGNLKIDNSTINVTGYIEVSGKLDMKTGILNIQTSPSKAKFLGDVDMTNNSQININGGDTVIVSGKLKLDDAIINIDGYLQTDGVVDMKNATINVSNPFGGKFRANSDVGMSNNSLINVAGGDTLTINGNLDMDNSDINVAGYIQANGNAHLQTNSTVCGTGNGNLAGTLTGSTWCFNILPIKLVSFEAIEENSHVVINWTTATEINNDYFTIESSTDNENYTAILKLSGTGNSTSKINYIAYDNNPQSGMNYYRLKQTDFDGHTEYFHAVAVIVNADKKANNMTLKSTGPNPFTSQFTVNFYLPNTSDVEVQMINSTGVIIFNDLVKADEGNNVFTYNDTQNINPGMYNLRVVRGKDVISKTIIKN